MSITSGFSQFLSNLVNTGLKNGGKISNAAAIFGFFAPVGPAVLGTYLMNRQYHKNGMPDDDRKMLISQEIANQGVNVFAHWFSFGMFFLLTHRIIRHFGDPSLLNPKPGPDGKNLNKEYQDAAAAIQNMFCALGGFFGMSVVRPILATTILKKWKEQQQGQKDDKKPNAVPMLNVVSSAPASPSAPPNVILAPMPRNNPFTAVAASTTPAFAPSLYNSPILPMRPVAIGT